MSQPQTTYQSQQISKNAKIIMISIQIAAFAIVSILCASKAIRSWKHNVKFLTYFYLCVFIYILIEIGLEIYVMIQITTDQTSLNQQMRLIASINILCILADIYIIAMLSVYWENIENQFRSQIRDSLQINQSRVIKRFIPIIIWTIVYGAYFIYLCIKQPDQQNEKYILYIGAQGITVILALIMIFLQIRNGMILLNTLSKYQALISFEMNRKRFLVIFWLSSVFNFARMLYLIAFTAYYFIQNSTNFKPAEAWIYYYAFTFSAIFPVVFYLLGFKLRNNNSLTQPVTNQSSAQSPSRIRYQPQSKQKTSKRSSSSYHETELAESL